MSQNEWLVSGQWNGFYMESHQPKRGWMHQYLEFNDGKMIGEGTDYVGPWTLQGTYDLSVCQAIWVKTYVGKHEVNYHGEVSDRGVIGIWDIREATQGPFHIWPQHLTEFDRLYMEEDLSETPLRRQPPPPGFRVG